jgi:hypothetical protein
LKERTDFSVSLSVFGCSTFFWVFGAAVFALVLLEAVLAPAFWTTVFSTGAATSLDSTFFGSFGGLFVTNSLRTRHLYIQ